MASVQKTLVFDEVSKHDKINDCWVIVYGKVYNVTPFMEEHPGGSEVLLAAACKDATEDFDNTGHSDEAIGMMDKYYVGKIDSSTVPSKRQYTLSSMTKSYGSNETQDFIIMMLKFLVPFLLLGLAFTIKA